MIAIAIYENNSVWGIRENPPLFFNIKIFIVFYVI